MTFTYRWGQRPLAGFSIKRGLGRGGFGEVYFAVSDGGKEVALKLIRGHNDTELRGIANCLNLKHPNLVHLYDLRTGTTGDHWLVMEYIQGEPLSTQLLRHPKGLAESQAREWFLQAARAVAYLHDHAVVHRDIKPANLFVEDGAVKLGDYGLSKSVGHSQHMQSSNVGTIHYMAPEVASGHYSKQIDIYACGVMLFEMLTGDVPFKGESWGEIAIKHQTDLPNLSKVPTAYVPILERALNKKAEKRFANMDEMIQAVEKFGQPASVTPIRTKSAPVQEPTIVTSVARPPIAGKTPRVEIPTGGRFRELSVSLFLAPLVAVPITAIWAIFTGSVNWHVLGALFLTMTAIAWSAMLASKPWEGREASRPRRLTLAAFGAGVGLLAFWFDGWMVPEVWMRDEALPAGLDSFWGGILKGEQAAVQMLTGYLVFFTLALMVPRWWLSVERRRSERFTLYPLFATGLWALILLHFWRDANVAKLPDPPGYLVLALAGAAAIVQLVSPWTPAPSRVPRFRRRLSESVAA